MSAETEENSFLQGISAKVSSVQIFEDDGKIGVQRDIEQAGDDKAEEMGSPVASSINGARQSLNENNHGTRFDLYDAMLDLDPELSGAVNAIAQSASSFEVVPPVDEPGSEGEKALEACKELNEKLDGDIMAIDILRNLIRYGNDINKKVYTKGEGITGIQNLPMNSLTIVDDRTDLMSPSDKAADGFSNLFQTSEEPEDIEETNELNEVFSRDAYVLNEDSTTKPPVIEPYNTLHFAIDYRSNWFTDYMGRDTYGVWGKSRLEPLTFTIQTKYNTMTNKVAMDDKLLAREIYYIDTTALFGDINDFEERKKKAEKYADQLRSMVEGLGPDERPILPDHVDIKVIGPEGKAIDQQPFIEQLNNSIAAALTFPMAGLGRGTTSVKAGEEISSLWAENNIRNLRRTVIRGYEEMFRDHLKLKFPEWVENENEASNLGEMRLQDDIEIPTLDYEPFKEEDMTQKARQIKLLHQTETASAAERREIYGLPTDVESINRLEDEFAVTDTGLGDEEAPPDDESAESQGGGQDNSESSNGESSDEGDNGE